MKKILYDTNFFEDTTGSLSCFVRDLAPDCYLDEDELLWDGLFESFEEAKRVRIASISCDLNKLAVELQRTNAMSVKNCPEKPDPYN